MGEITRRAQALKRLCTAVPAEDVSKIVRRMYPPLLQQLPYNVAVVHGMDELLAAFSVSDLDQLAAEIITRRTMVDAFARP